MIATPARTNDPQNTNELATDMSLSPIAEVFTGFVLRQRSNHTDCQNVSVNAAEESAIRLIEQGTYGSRTELGLRNGRCTSRQSAMIPAKTSTPSIVEFVHRSLAATGYPLHNVQCSFDGDSVILSGRVKCYYHAQMAIETARRSAPGTQIVTKLEVASTKTT